MITIMKWNDVELIDGKFYFAELKRWPDGEPDNWVFAYKDNNDYITKHHVCARVEGTYSSICSIYDFGYLCSRDEIIDLRPASREDMDAFWSYLDRWDYKYCLNTKKLRYVGSR